MNRNKDEECTDTGVVSRRLLRYIMVFLAKDLTSKLGRKQSFNTVDTEESDEEDEGMKTAEEADEEESKMEDTTLFMGEKKRKRRKKGRIRLTDQGLKAKRKAERRERLLAERKDVDDLTAIEGGCENGKELAEKDDKESDKPQLKIKPHPNPGTFTPFQLFCDNILRKFVLKDPEGYFTNPVSNEQAPDYQSIIENPMDFSTIRNKIEENDYAELEEFRKDVELIVNNAQTYNSQGTLFYIAAQKLAALSRYYFSEKYITFLIYSLPFGRMVPAEHLGVNLSTQSKEKSRQELSKERGREKIRSLIKDTMTPHEIMAMSSKGVKNRLTSRTPNCHISYLDKRGGAIALNIITPGGEESRLKLGDYLKPLEKGTPGICIPFEPVITQDYPTSYTNPGPFASFAPQFDSTWATISKKDSDLLLSCYGDEDAAARAFSLRQMVANASETANSVVEQMLNEITEGDHELTIAQLEGKGQQIEKVSDPSPTDLRLQKTGKMLENLATIQHKRLSSQPPSTLSHALKPDAEEGQLAGEIVQQLGENIIGMEARPRDVVTPRAVHDAFGLDADDYEVISEFLEV